MNMHILDDNIKIIIKTLVLILDLILHFNTGWRGIFWKVSGVILHINNKYFYQFSNWRFLKSDLDPWFSLTEYFKIFWTDEKMTYVLKKQRILLTQDYEMLD